jgi:putative DNA primase/helicase
MAAPLWLCATGEEAERFARLGLDAIEGNTERPNSCYAQYRGRLVIATPAAANSRRGTAAVFHAYGARVEVLLSNGADLGVVNDLLAIPREPMFVEAEPADTETGTRDLSGDQAAILRLATLAPMDYDRVRESEAKKLNVRVGTLDAEVRKARGEPETELAGNAVMFTELDPWPDQVNGETLLDELAATIECFVIMGKHAMVAVVLWVVFTYLIDEVQVAPMLAVTSPEKRCGKTTLLDLLTRVVSRALPSSNISPAALFRAIEKWRPTLIIDEADSFVGNSEELRGLLNSGHTRATAFVIRNVGDDHEPRRFSTWGAKAIALIGRLPDTNEDRSIVVGLRRKLPGEKAAKLHRADVATFEMLTRRLKRWATDQAAAIKRTQAQIPEELHDRAGDNWEPLLAIADAAGGKWPTMAREAARVLSGGARGTDSVAVELLADVREVLHSKELDRVSSETLVEHLCADPTRRWATYNKGKWVSQRQVASLLRRFDIAPNTIRIGDKTPRGYLVDWFSEAFARYLPPLEAQQRHNPRQKPISEDFASETVESVLRMQESRKAAPDVACSGVADRNGVIGAEEAGEVL